MISLRNLFSFAITYYYYITYTSLTLNIMDLRLSHYLYSETIYAKALYKYMFIM